MPYRSPRQIKHAIYIDGQQAAPIFIGGAIGIGSQYDPGTIDQYADPSAGSNDVVDYSIAKC